MKWHSLIDSKDNSIYVQKLSEIADVLLRVSEEAKGNIGVMGGQSGIALFFFYYARLTGQYKYARFANDLLNNIFEEISDNFSHHTFSAGLAGVGWLMEHLAENNFLDVDTDDVLGSLDSFMHDALIYDLEKRNYDFLHGAIGSGVYFMSRGKGKTNSESLTVLLNYLDNIKDEPAEGKVAWKSVLDDDGETVTGFNLGLAHGNASIIVFLSHLLPLGIDDKKIAYLLDCSVEFLLAHEQETGKYLFKFPNWVGEKFTFGPSRLAWCYGDLGIGAALWQAAQSRGNKEWEKKSLETLLHSTGRRDLKENFVRDAGLCHGTAGICHIYNRMFHYSGNSTFREAALFWLAETMKMASHEDGFAGFKTWYFDREGGAGPEPGFLGGVAGIGLMLISILSDQEPKWDRSLLLS